MAPGGPPRAAANGPGRCGSARLEGATGGRPSGLAGGIDPQHRQPGGEPLDETVLGALDRVVVDTGEPHDEWAVLRARGRRGRRPARALKSSRRAAPTIARATGPPCRRRIGRPRSTSGTAGRSVPWWRRLVHRDLAVRGRVEVELVRHHVVAERPRSGAQGGSSSSGRARPRAPRPVRGRRADAVPAGPPEVVPPCPASSVRQNPRSPCTTSGLAKARARRADPPIPRQTSAIAYAGRGSATSPVSTTARLPAVSFAA